MKKIRWGIVGLGGISHRFAEGLSFVEGAELIACGSRSFEKSLQFSTKWNVKRAYGSYEAIFNDPEVDVIYIATPHPFHYENAREALLNGKAVLCEKPFTLNALQAEDLIGISRLKKIFLMEAMWTRFLPQMRKLKSMIAQGVIGDVVKIEADFGFASRVEPQGRLWGPHLGGGALLDVGVYPLSLAFYLLGKPKRVTSQVKMGETGVDAASSLVLEYGESQKAFLSSSIMETTPQVAVIHGTEGVLKLTTPWWGPASKLFLIQNSRETEVPVDVQGNGYNYEAEEVAVCLEKGLLESETISLNESLEIMRCMDALRQEWGVVYPMEVLDKEIIW